MSELSLFEVESAGRLRSSKQADMAGGRPDDFQTPPEAILPLLPFLPPNWHIWECASGKGNLVRAFESYGYAVTGSDVLTGQDFLKWQPPAFDCIVTNPPFSLKSEFLRRAYWLEKPFAFLLPLTTFEGRLRQGFFRHYGVQVVFMPKRINFETPTGKGGGSWFMTAWFTWGLKLPNDLVFWEPK